ncbi:MAG: addiction module protein [Balneola sp.]
MNSTLKEIKTSALQLDEKDRLQLLQSLVKSLDRNKTLLYENEWLSIAKERRVNYEAGKTGTTSWQDIKKELDKKVRS